MAEPHVLSGLKAKRVEIASQIEGLQLHIRQLAIDLENIDATLRIFDPSIDMKAIRARRRLPPLQNGGRFNIGRFLLTTFRQTSEPTTSHALALLVMGEMGLKTTDVVMVGTMMKRVQGRLRRLRERKLVRSMPGPGQVNLWEVVR
ncbi:MAG TPA: hypothetical protein VK479_06445 [Micropepsaceae bacterium]|nr:hypothetical protein [Micropepsaceae bacterium]